jgi:hypothetical protein
MIADHFAPIPCPLPDPRKPVTLVHVTVLEPATVQPCYEGMDDQGDWMLNGGKELLEGMLNVECPEASHG